MRWTLGCALAISMVACSHPSVRIVPQTSTLRMPDRARVLVFAPHPDDETLAVGGLIHRLTKSGVPVRVIFITNGDGYPHAVMEELGKPHPTGSDYLAFGALRQREAIAAVRKLGLGGGSVRFLGFPDGGLAELWRTHWALPYVSPYTGKNRPSYADTADPHVEYEGRDLTAVMARLLADFRPTVVIMPHPSDTHPDHSTASWFVTEAVQRVQAEGRLPGDVRLLTYLVHYPSWPKLTGPAQDRRLVPIAGLTGTVWSEADLTPEELAAKRAALGEYKSQLDVMRGFLRSFAGDNELLAAIDPQLLARIAAVH
jgi:LmbE family N-acetylglucosaminyl deacetylase